MKFNIFITIVSVMQHVKLDIIDNWRQICPHNDLCTVGKLVNFNATSEYLPCCSKCFCDKDCTQFHDCCPDLEGQVTMLSGTQCTTTAVNNPIVQSLDDEIRERRFIPLRMTSSCPTHFTEDTTIIDMCNEKFENYPSSDDMVMVSNRYHHDDIYKNKYCASCNGVQETIRWNFHVTWCPNVWDGRTPFSELKELIWNNCTLYSTPPTHLTFSRPLFDCGSRLISNCTDTNSTFRASCETGPYAPLYVPSLFVRVYKNPMCYLCQKDQIASSNTCRRDFLDVRKAGFGGRMSMLLQMDSSIPSGRKSQETTEKKQCDEREIYDRLQDRCRTLSCPWNSVVFYGRCLKFSDSIFNVDVSVRLLFRPVHLDQLHGKVVKYDSSLQSEIVSNLRNRFGLKECTIQKATVLLYREKTNNMTSFLLVDLFIRVSQECSVDFVFSNTRRLAKRSHKMLVRVIDEAVLMIGNVYFFQPLNSFDLSVYYKDVVIAQDNRWTIPFFITDFYICPYLKLNLSEYNSLMTKFGQNSAAHINATSLVYNGFYVLSHDDIAVCVDTYFDLSEKKGINCAEATTFKRIFSLNDCRQLSIILLIFHYVCLETNL